MEIIKIDINDLKPYEKNAKIHTQEQIEQIKQEMEQNIKKNTLKFTYSHTFLW